MAATNPARALGLHASIAGGNRWVVAGGAARQRVANDEAVGGAPHRRERKGPKGRWCVDRTRGEGKKQCDKRVLLVPPAGGALEVLAPLPGGQFGDECRFQLV